MRICILYIYKIIIHFNECPAVGCGLLASGPLRALPRAPRSPAPPPQGDSNQGPREFPLPTPGITDTDRPLITYGVAATYRLTPARAAPIAYPGCRWAGRSEEQGYTSPRDRQPSRLRHPSGTSSAEWMEPQVAEAASGRARKPTGSSCRGCPQASWYTDYSLGAAALAAAPSSFPPPDISALRGRSASAIIYYILA